MKILRRRVRSAFLLGAVTFIGLVAISVIHPEYAVIYGAASYYGLLLISALLAVLYGGAWLTTRKPSPYRNNWAVGASSLSLLWGFFVAYAIYRIMPGRIEAEIPAIITILVGATGLYLYGPGGSPEKPKSVENFDLPTKKREEDRATSVLSERRSMSAPTAVAPSVAALRASSPELAMAAESPEALDGPRDPLAFIRTRETLEKLRG
jgi:hypothetical protein